VAATIVPAPRLTILDSLVYEADPPDFQNNYYTARWQKLLMSLSEEARAMIMSETLPFGLSEEDWGTYLASELDGDPSALTARLNQLAEGCVEAPPLPETQQHIVSSFSRSLPFLKNADLAQEQAPSGPCESIEREDVEGISDAFRNIDPQTLRIIEAVYCREIGNPISLTFSLNQDRSNLVSGPVNICEGIEMDRPFLASDHTMKGRILYIHGTNDTVTSLAGAEQHFATQTEKDRAFLTVADGTHGAIVDLDRTCLEQLWNWSLSDAFSAGPPVACDNTTYTLPGL
jgi:hypothetical protein